MINYLTGDLFTLLPASPEAPIFIPHIVNNEKKWGSGFVIPLGKKFPSARNVYLDSPGKHLLGETKIVLVANTPSNGIYVCNMVAQDGLISTNNPKPIKYAALVKCMEYIKEKIGENGEIWCPMFGSARAGGNWDFIEALIKEIWLTIPVTICKYDQ